MAADRAELNLLKNGPVVHAIHYQPPPFIVRVPEGSYPVVGGYIYLATGAEAGHKLIAAYSLQDPSLRVRDQLLRTFAGDLGIVAQQPEQDDLEHDDLDTLRARFPAAVVLDFKTTLWTLQHVLFESGHRFLFQMRARLLRTSDGKVLWQGYCMFHPGETANVEWEQLNADHGAILKIKMQEAADACSDRLRAQLLDGSDEIRVK